VPEKRDNDLRTPVERRVESSFEDAEAALGRPLSWHARKTRRSVESYLKAGVVPRYMQRLRQIERDTERHERELAKAYERLREELGHDPEELARRWRERVGRWSFEDTNELIRQHNEWYPIESGLPVDVRTRDYVKVRGRSYRREELGPAWALERFPPSGGGASACEP